MSKSFSFNTVEDFDLHIRNSIPDYENLINMILKISDFFIISQTNVYDLGASTGSFLHKLKDKVELRDVNFIGIENEQNFYEHHTDWEIKWVHEDITKYQGWSEASFMTSIFTIQFIEPNKRLPLLQKIFNCMTPGSGFIFAEKIYSESAKIQDVNTFLHYDWKRQYFSSDEILKKERDLRTLMKLRTKKEIESEMLDVGWKSCETFWQQHNFVGWMATK